MRAALYSKKVAPNPPALSEGATQTVAD